MKIGLMKAKDKPREKLLRYGPDKLKDFELLAILLGVGTKTVDVIELSKNILRQKDGNELANATPKDLTKIHGLGEARAAEIVACFELGRRMIHGKQTALVLSPKDVWERMVDVRQSKREHFAVFYLDSRSQEIKRDIISVGTINASLVHPREVFEQAIKNSASAIILAHNHPSGDTEPSNADIEITKEIVTAGKLLDISVNDHVIVTNSAWRGILKEIYV